MVIANLQGRTFAWTSKADNVLQHIFRKQSQIALSAKPAQHILAVRKIKDLKRAPANLLPLDQDTLQLDHHLQKH